MASVDQMALDWHERHDRRKARHTYSARQASTASAAIGAADNSERSVQLDEAELRKRRKELLARFLKLRKAANPKTAKAEKCQAKWDKKKAKAALAKEGDAKEGSVRDMPPEEERKKQQEEARLLAQVRLSTCQERVMLAPGNFNLYILHPERQSSNPAPNPQTPRLKPSPGSAVFC
ncbi:unnamed protein product [Symbiodinium microadriaticum]|nr:unnamed protein product [Symbiodinium microadriaticum]